MHYAKTWIPMTLLAAAATIAGVACSDKGSDSEGRSQTAQSEQRGGPPGNNGTVKIQELDGIKEVPDNDPHVRCGFQIEFRGFDEGALFAQYTLTGHPPSDKERTVLLDSQVAIGEDGAGGANDLDARVRIDIAQLDLSALEEHPQQGYHLRLTVHAEGSRGADTKHKVFWVTKCAAPPPPPDAGPPPPPPDAGPPPPPPPDAGPPPPPPPEDAGGGKTW